MLVEEMQRKSNCMKPIIINNYDMEEGERDDCVSKSFNNVFHIQKGIMCNQGAAHPWSVQFGVQLPPL